jgi:hypothetical protein
MLNMLTLANGDFKPNIVWKTCLRVQVSSLVALNETGWISGSPMMSFGIGENDIIMTMTVSS